MTKCKLTFTVTVLSLLCILPSCTEQQTDASYKVHAERLKQTFESSLFTFSPTKQKHYAVRLYRITGDKRYVYPIIFDLMIRLKTLHHDERGLHDPEYIKRLTDPVINNESSFGTINPESRRSALPKGGDLIFYRKLCKNINTLREYNLIDTRMFPATDEMMEALHDQKERLAAFLLDRELMKTSGAQLANYVYYLYRLNVIDIRRDYIDGLQEALMKEKQDSALSDAQYCDKIYGLTHVILAASDYYQEYVDQKAFAWILDYFEQNIETILTRTKPDIYAEVGLCFLLAKDNDSQALKKIKDTIVSDINPEKGMILSVKGSDDLPKGEHRNVLAVMLLDWPASLFPGPDLRNMPEFQNLLPMPERQDGVQNLN